MTKAFLKEGKKEIHREGNLLQILLLGIDRKSDLFPELAKFGLALPPVLPCSFPWPGKR